MEVKGRKRAAPRGRGKGRGATPSKRGKKTDNSSVRGLRMNKDDDGDDDDVPKRFKQSQPRVTRNYGALRR